MLLIVSCSTISMRSIKCKSNQFFELPEPVQQAIIKEYVSKANTNGTFSGAYSNFITNLDSQFVKVQTKLDHYNGASGIDDAIIKIGSVKIQNDLMYGMGKAPFVLYNKKIYCISENSYFNRKSIYKVNCCVRDFSDVLDYEL